MKGTLVALSGAPVVVWLVATIVSAALIARSASRRGGDVPLTTRIWWGVLVGLGLSVGLATGDLLRGLAWARDWTGLVPATLGVELAVGLATGVVLAWQLFGSSKLDRKR